MLFISHEDVSHPELNTLLLKEGEAYPVHVVNHLFQEYGLDNVKGIYCSDTFLNNN
jgi:hypothetical protein